MRCQLTLLGLILSLAASTAAYAMPASLKATGMGGAAVAYAQDSLTTVDNPANAADISRRFDLGFSWWGRDQSLTIDHRPTPLLQQGDLDPNNTNQWFGHCGINFWLDPCIAMGLAFHNERDIHTQYGVRLEDFAAVDAAGAFTGPNARFEYTVNTITATIAHRFWEVHAIGLSVNVDIARMDVAGLGRIATPPPPIPPLSDSPGSVTDRNHDEATGVGITIGWTGYLAAEKLPGLAFGLAFSPKTTMGQLRKYRGLLADHRLATPAKYRFGVAWELTPCVALACDFEFLHYSKTHSWSNRFPKDSTTGIGALFGTRDGPGFDWRDQCIVKAGADWQFCPNWTVRAGYRFESSLIRGGPSSALNVLTFQTIQNFVTAGITWNIDSCFDFTAFGEYGFPGSRHSQIPSITDSGAVVFAPADLYLKAKTVRAGLSYGLRF